MPGERRGKVTDRLPFRVVMLTNGSPHARRILDRLHDRGITIAAVVLVTMMPWQDLLRSSGGIGERLASLIKVPFRPLKRFMEHSRFRRANRRYAEQVLVTGPLNSPRMQRALERLSPDFILLGGIGILKKNILETARRGVINTHPGLLPWLRGTGVVAQAIDKGIPVGGTAHYVSAGIDTGGIIERRLLPISAGARSLDDLEENADLLTADMMADLVSERLALGEVPEAESQSEKFPYCNWMTGERREAIEKAVAEGKAAEAFDLWAGCCTDRERYVLPFDFVEPGRS